MAKPWMEYLGRCSFMLQQGNFVGDVLYYYGDSVPNFVPAKRTWPELGFGYDYDVTNSDILLNKLEVLNGRLVLPHGQSYELLALPNETYMQPEVLDKIQYLVEQGATVVGPKPIRSHGLFNWEQRDQRVRELADKLWGEGGVIQGPSLRTILMDKGIGPDFDFRGESGNNSVDFIHRSLDKNDIYFVRNRVDRPISGTALFRQMGKQVEIWDPSNGKMFGGFDSGEVDGYTEIPITLDEYGSLFVVFTSHGGQKELDSFIGEFSQFPLSKSILEEVGIQGPWRVHFPERSAGAGTVEFDSLVFWNKRNEDGIRFFSGIATYEKEFEWDSRVGDKNQIVFLEFDQVVEVAHVYLNGTDLGILWKKPFRIEITDALIVGNNELKVEVANTWANGLAGDARLPADKRLTKTNVTRLPNAWTFPLQDIPNEDYDLLEGGIAGPIKISKFNTQ
jgi:hypothetical protein